MVALFETTLVADLPPPPPFSLFSGDVPSMGLSIAVIFIGAAMAGAAIWFVMRRQRSGR